VEKGDSQENFPHWTYIPNWKISMLPVKGTDENAYKPDNPLTWLVFGEAEGLTTQVVRVLQRQEQRVVRVIAGPGFSWSKTAGVVEITANPSQEEQFGLMMDTLQTLLMIPDRVVHMWGVIDNTGEMKGRNNGWFSEIRHRVFDSLVFLAKAWGRKGIDKPIQLTAVTSHMQGVYGSDALYPEKALVLGLVRTIPKEYPQISCRSIDFELETMDLINKKSNWPWEQTASRLWREITSGSADVVVVYRGINRLVPSFDPHPLPDPGSMKTIPRLRPKGVYMITGGLGGIGLTLARFLAETVQARLLLLDRAAIPPREEWEQRMSLQSSATPPTQNNEDRINSKIKSLVEMENLGAEIMVRNADVSDLHQMRGVLNEVENKWGPVNGIIHAAGIVMGGLIQQISLRQIQEGFSSKVYGTLALDELVRERWIENTITSSTSSPLDFFILCSSLNTLAGVMGEAIYCSANAYLDAYAHYASAKYSFFTHAVNWDAWQNVGFAEEVHKQWLNTLINTGGGSPVDELFKHGIKPEQGVEIFKRILCAGTPQIAVSTIPLEEKFKKSAGLETMLLKPITAPKLSKSRYPRPELSIPYTPPFNETEKQLCETWERFLGIDHVGIHDNFFDLGATSLGIIQVTAIINETMGKSKTIAAPTLYAFPTIAELARHLNPDPVSTQTVEESGKYLDPESLKEGKNRLAQRKQRLSQEYFQ